MPDQNDTITPEEAQRRLSINYTGPDLYQQARIALRDRTGTEPADELVRSVVEVMENENLTPAAAVSAWQLANADTVPAPDETPNTNEAQAIADTFILVLGRGIEVRAQLIVSADTTAGLARLRAHSALDGLLDEAGVSR